MPYLRKLELESFDNKIAINNKINDYLEQQCFALFRHLFVEEAMPEWEIGTIADLGEVVGGSTPPKAKPEYYTKYGIAWITPKDLSINKNKFIAHGADDITELGLRNSSARLLPRGTVLFSSRAPIGYIAIASGEVSTNQGFKSVIPKEGVGTAFVYFFLKYNLQTIEGMASGSTFKEVSGATMKSIPAVIPDIHTLIRFRDACAPMFEQQELLERENAHLAALRDALLPRLMSGKLSVTDLEL
jgi:type I restriction enzyme S subunit